MTPLEKDKQFISILEAVPKLGNITAAAEMLFMTQPALSKLIRQREEQLGVQLIDRRHHPLRLTYSGEYYLHRLRHIVAQYDSLYHGLAVLNEAGHGRLTIGVTQSLGEQILPRLLPEYHATYPNVDLRLVEYPSSEVETELINDNLDLYIGVLPIDNSQIHYQLLYREPVCLVLSPSHPAYQAQIKKLRLINSSHELIDNQPMIMENKNSGFQRFIDQYLTKNNIYPKVILRTASLNTAIKLVQHNFAAATLVPRSVWQSHPTKARLNTFQLATEELQSETFIAYKRDRLLTSQEKALIDLAIKWGQRATLG
ncbi:MULTISPECIES: LysR family transcriptional regulator [Loigolactobacillus]|uniref:LysR family transcriptional regulator n=1 Tax=Loigolactobacillus TaxID=2767889 RepID=UPI0007F0AAFA|nr:MULTISPECIES: LysR family transcriptional regulator [Loigolactobacillus]ANK60533.1 transcriptional regulator [Loigolactobacillus backii]ANK65484.1 transcriptional regulator [Loigolactobacillus backii]ANK67958.1 transcriptional regulator [Loigolactobacillus backii]MDA5387898.1 LysR family transcriptional regulator [Loigolactobacillus backii]MDA5390390.1 LysR family transcriptional regulator [Loigolactobacillus backii]